MKKSMLLLCVLVSSVCVFGQTTTFDNLNANNYVNKAISWNSSNYGSGFGHRIINSDPGGQTLLNFQGRHNSTSWADIMTLTSSGKVGIGTTNPNTQLTVGNNFGASISGTSGGNAIFGTNLALQQGGTNHNKLYTPYSHSNNYGYAGVRTSWSKIYFYAEKNNTTANQVVTPVPKMTITDLGNVGIGTSNPGAKLQLVANNTHFSIRPESNSSGTLITSGQQLHLVFNDNNAGTDYFTIRNNGTTINTTNELLRVTSDGKMGLGTTAPDAKLTVNGNIHAKEVKIDLNVPAPDYVFLKDYDLKTINEVAAYIKEKGHLPNIPSATEMETNGVELGLMNMKLLEKIEELTLYTIAQEKKLKTQEEKLRSSDSRLQTLQTTNQNLEARLVKIEALLNKK